MKKKIKIIIFIVLMLFMTKSIWSICQEEILQTETSEHKLKGSGQNVGEIDGKVEIAQTFKEEKDFCGISLLSANYGRKMFGTIHLELIDNETNQIILEKDYDGKQINNDQMNYYIFDNIVKVSEPHQYKVVITADVKVFFSHFTLWHTGKDKYKDGAMFINGKQQKADLVFDTVYKYEKVNTLGIKSHRISLIVLFFGFLGLHCFLDIRKMYQWIFEKRVWVALAFFVFLVANKYNFSSLAEYNAYIEPDEGSQYTEPLFGNSRPIRSDEWMVSLPRYLSAEYSDYGEYNGVVRAEKTTNLSASGLYRSYSALAQPSFWGYYLFGSEIGTSFMWCFNMIFGFLFSYEICLILTKKKPLLALLGGTLIWFSSYNMWWSTVNWLIAGQAALVCFYYFLNRKSIVQRFLFGIGTGIFAANFIINLYPAWQVPAGYVYFGILVWMLVKNWENVKSYKWKDWGIAILCIAFMLSITGIYFKNNTEYLTDIMNTVYPGKRISYGGFKIDKLLGYIACFWSPYRAFANPSEMGCFVTLFPIPYIMGIWVFIKNIKEKNRDIFLGFLLLIATILGVYCILPLPHFLAKVLLLTYSTPYRAADILGYVMVLLLIVILGQYGSKAKWKPLPAVLLTGTVLAGTFWYTEVEYGHFLQLPYFLVITIGLFVVFTILIADFNKKLEKAAIIVLSTAVLVTGLAVNPLMCGLDVIYSRPVAKEIQEIVEKDPDGKWIACDSGMAANYLIACGAPTINSVNYIPNMKLWRKLDPTGKQEEIYNRYAHINVNLTNEDTTMSLKQADVILLKLSLEDLEKINAKYIYSNKKLTGTDTVQLQLLYKNKKTYIYQAIYYK